MLYYNKILSQHIINKKLRYFTFFLCILNLTQAMSKMTAVLDHAGLLHISFL